MKWLILLLGVLSNASASVLIKVAMSSKDEQLQNIQSIITNPPLLSGVCLYGIAFVLYALALTHLPLNVAHPILTSGSIAIVGIASVSLFGESLSIINVFGIVFIILGVCALTVN